MFKLLYKYILDITPYDHMSYDNNPRLAAICNSIKYLESAIGEKPMPKTESEFKKELVTHIKQHLGLDILGFKFAEDSNQFPEFKSYEPEALSRLFRRDVMSKLVTKYQALECANLFPVNREEASTSYSLAMFDVFFTKSKDGRYLLKLAGFEIIKDEEILAGGISNEIPLVPASYKVMIGDESFTTRVIKTDKQGNPSMYAVEVGNSFLNKKGQAIHSRLPSSRDDTYYDEIGFTSLEEVKRVFFALLMSEDRYRLVDRHIEFNNE